MCYVTKPLEHKQEGLESRGDVCLHYCPQGISGGGMIMLRWPAVGGVGIYIPLEKGRGREQQEIIGEELDMEACKNQIFFCKGMG